MEILSKTKFTYQFTFFLKSSLEEAFKQDTNNTNYTLIFYNIIIFLGEGQIRQIVCFAFDSSRQILTKSVIIV